MQKNVFGIQCKDYFRGSNLNYNGNHCDAALRLYFSMWLRLAVVRTGRWV